MPSSLPLLPEVDTGLPMRPYQREAFDRTLKAHADGKAGGLVVLPTGAGKTIVAVKLQQALDTRCVFLTHRDELGDQAIAKFLAADPSIDIGLVKAESDDLTARVVVASVQTLANERRLDRLCRAVAGRPLLVISDEAHHDPSPTRRVALQRLEAASIAPFRVGLTATPMRHTRKGDENASLRTLYPDGILYQVSMVELMASGYLAWLRAKAVETQIDLSEVATRGGDLVASQVAERVNDEARNTLVVDAYEQHALGDENPRTRTVVFCVDRAHAYAEQATFRQRGHEAGLILGTTPKAERSAIYRAFREGSLPVLIGVDVFTEGWDEPAVDCGIMARPTESLVLYTQMVGRLLRVSRATGKVDALALDVTDVAGRHRLQNFWTLAEAEGLLPEARETTAGETRTRTASLQQLALAASEGRERKAREVKVFGRSEYAWMPVAVDGRTLYVAAVANNIWVYLEPTGRETYLPRLLEGGELKGDGYNRYRTPTKRTDLFVRALDIETAMGIAEARGTLYMGDNPILKRTASWRGVRKSPTEAQVRFATRLGIKPEPKETIGSLSAKIEAKLFSREYARTERA